MRARLALTLTIALTLVAALVAGGCGDDKKSSSGPDTPKLAVDEPATTTATKLPEALKHKPKVPKVDANTKTLIKKDLIVGTGPVVKPDANVTVQYVGVLAKNGKQFDASWDRNQPFPVQLGQGAVIPGWDQGVPGMKIGGRRLLVIPPKLAYGSQGQNGIPPNSTLAFVIDADSLG